MQTSVILYYKFVTLPDPEAERLAQRALCERLGLKGRLLLATEGINGTLAGAASAIDSYITAMEGHPLFSGIDYKRSLSQDIPFPRLRIRVRPEIVTLGITVDTTDAGTKLTPAEFHALVQDPEVVVLDARNNYESAIGKFRGALTPNINLFKDLPRALRDYDDLKHKKIVTYCTGGIRCEKASALMKQRGFKDVYQLEGGIIKYAQSYPDGQFEGECFIFDDRMSVAFTDSPGLIGKCHVCSAPTNTYRDCANLACHKLVLLCGNCLVAAKACSLDCREALSLAVAVPSPLS